MMTNEQATPVSGTLMCGADGALYFIPDRDLAAYRLAEEEAGQVRALLDGRSDVGGFAIRQPGPIAPQLPALRGARVESPRDALSGYYLSDVLISKESGRNSK
jgi:hypothetical protein